MIRFEHVSFSYEQKLILDDISFCVPKGSFTALIGPNGSGKTTLLKCLLGIIQPKGEIFLEGKAPKTYTAWDRIGYVRQMSHTYNTSMPVSVKEVMEMGFQRRATDEEIDALLAFFHIESYRTSQIGSLSGGEQQKVFIARSFVTNPHLFIFDEPTVGLDMMSMRIFYDHLDLLQHAGKTIFIVSHDLHLLDQRITQVIHIDQGKIRFCGSRADYLHWHSQECQWCEETI